MAISPERLSSFDGPHFPPGHKDATGVGPDAVAAFRTSSGQRQSITDFFLARKGSESQWRDSFPLLYFFLVYFIEGRRGGNQCCEPRHLTIFFIFSPRRCLSRWLQLRVPPLGDFSSASSSSITLMPHFRTTSTSRTRMPRSASPKLTLNTGGRKTGVELIGDGL